jgi:hypothetical protein
VAVRVHAPSRVHYHNVRRLEDGEPGQVSRGNILTWEQALGRRLGGVPLDVELRMESRSILADTLWVFGGASLAALLALSGLIGWAVRRRKPRQPGDSVSPPSSP